MSCLLALLTEWSCRWQSNTGRAPATFCMVSWTLLNMKIWFFLSQTTKIFYIISQFHYISHLSLQLTARCKNNTKKKKTTQEKQLMLLKKKKIIIIRKTKEKNKKTKSNLLLLNPPDNGYERNSAPTCNFIGHAVQKCTVYILFSLFKTQSTPLKL